MMDRLVFAPLIDLPLAMLMLLGLLLHFNRWARSDQADTSVDLVSRLPIARTRVVLLFVGLVVFCWLLNIAFWALSAFLLAAGVVVVVLMGAPPEGSGIFLLFAAYVIREWAFDFPQLVLQPPSAEAPTAAASVEVNELLGIEGTVISPLRPSGDAELKGRKMSVVSDGGQLIEVGTAVVVSGSRNGRLCVRPIEATVDSGNLESTTE